MLELAFLVLGAILAAALLHELVLALVGLLPASPPPRVAPGRELRFAVVVPAHDEEASIARTLASLAALEYPKDRVRIVVVADHCSDRTASVARAHGAEVLERAGSEPRGKGHALAWAFPRLLAAGDAQAFCVVDADTRVEPSLLACLAARLARGEGAVQAYYDLEAPERSVAASVTWLGFALSRRLKYHPRARLGLGANLVGNGMAFARATLERVPWRATSASEDLEMQLELALEGVRVDFALETRVWGEVAAPGAGFRRQRARWDLGRAALRRRYLGRLLRGGIARRDPLLLETAVELLVPPYTLLGGLVLGLLGAWLLVAGVGPAEPTGWPFPLLVALVGGYGLLVLLALLVSRPPLRVVANLVAAPLLLVPRLRNAWAGLVRRREAVWEEPAREGSAAAPADDAGGGADGDRAGR